MEELQHPLIFRKVLESLHTGICIETRERRIIFWNDGAGRITGYQSHEVVGRQHENLLGECSGQVCAICRVECPFTRALQDGRTVEASIQFRHKDGHRVPLRATIIPLRDDHGSLIGLASSFDEQKFVSERERRQKRFAAGGCLDPTTGIPNHGFTQFQLRENLAGLVEYKLPFSVLRIQVEQLEEFRHKYGTEAADAILRALAQTLQNSLRPSDFLGRWDTNEFLAILTNCTEAGVATAAERSRKTVSGAAIQWWGDNISVSVSIGFATALQGESIDLLLGRALRSREHSTAKRMAATADSGPRSGD